MNRRVYILTAGFSLVLAAGAPVAGSSPAKAYGHPDAAFAIVDFEAGNAKPSGNGQARLDAFARIFAADFRPISVALVCPARAKPRLAAERLTYVLAVLEKAGAVPIHLLDDADCGDLGGRDDGQILLRSAPAELFEKSTR